MTTDHDRGHRIGLHLDSWERAQFHERRFARNRISVNLGEEPRRLLFMATPIEIVFREFGMSREMNTYAVDQAFRAVPRNNLNVYSLSILPGEAYVAPTECLVHDGSTQGRRSIDFNLTVRVATTPFMSLESTYKDENLDVS